MLRRIATASSSSRIEDLFFGSMRYVSCPDPSESYWEGTTLFTPARGEVEVFVDAGDEGPEDEQRELFRTMEQRWDEIWESTRPELVRVGEKWFGGSMPDVPERVFPLLSVSVPRAESDQMEWELGFDFLSDPEHIVTLHLKGWKATGEVTIDG